MAALPANQIPNGGDPNRWVEVVRSGRGGVTLCLSPALARAWADGLDGALGARAVYLGPNVVAAIREASDGNAAD